MAKTPDNSKLIARMDCNRRVKPLGSTARRYGFHDRPMDREDLYQCQSDDPMSSFLTLKR